MDLTTLRTILQAARSNPTLKGLERLKGLRVAADTQETACELEGTIEDLEVILGIDATA